jgi:hypothetical protein
MLNGDMLAAEAIAAMGGKVTPERVQAFQKFCAAIVQHIQTQGVVNVVVTASGTVTTGAGAGGLVVTAGTGAGTVT